MELTVQKFLEAGADSLSIKVLAGETHLDRVIDELALNRPGLALAGFFSTSHSGASRCSAWPRSRT